MAGLTWTQFEKARADFASFGRRMFYQHGLGLGFLATTRPDGGPRVHPICPILTDEGLYGMIVPGPKLHDLRRDPRYALHSETRPPPDQDDAFYITGVAVESEDRVLWERVAAQMLEERNLSEPWPEFEEQILFEFMISTCLATVTIANDDLPAGHTVWKG